MNQNRSRTLLFAGVVVAAMLVGGVVGATVLAKSAISTVNAATPTAPPKSNEATTHETGETLAQEAAENNGTARPANGPSNETQAHETGESTAREAAEKT
jgi:uncharacterized membrane protein